MPKKRLRLLKLNPDYQRSGRPSENSAATRSACSGHAEGRVQNPRSSKAYPRVRLQKNGFSRLRAPAQAPRRQSESQSDGMAMLPSCELTIPRNPIISISNFPISFLFCAKCGNCAREQLREVHRRKKPGRTLRFPLAAMRGRRALTNAAPTYCGAIFSSTGRFEISGVRRRAESLAPESLRASARTI